MISIYWLILLIIWSIVLCFNISDYIQYKEFRTIHNILLDIFWIELSISYIIMSLRSLEIRENGIYTFYGDFYKWTNIQSYSWILPNKIQFKANGNFNINRSFEITIKEELKLKVEEIIQKKLGV